MQLAAQWPSLRALGFRLRPRFGRAVLADPGIRRIGRLMGAAVIGLSATQVNILVNTIFASHEVGANTWLLMAFRLMQLPLGVFGVAIATVAGAGVAQRVAAGDMDGVRETLGSAMRLVAFLNVPAAVGLIALAQPIISLVYEHGRFGAADASATADALVFYAIGLYGYSAVKVFAPAFYALDEARVPVIASVVGMASNVALVLLLHPVLGFRGIALGTALAATANFAVLAVAWGGATGGWEGRGSTGSSPGPCSPRRSWSARCCAVKAALAPPSGGGDGPAGAAGARAHRGRRGGVLRRRPAPRGEGARRGGLGAPPSPAAVAAVAARTLLEHLEHHGEGLAGLLAELLVALDLLVGPEHALLVLGRAASRAPGPGGTGSVARASASARKPPRLPGGTRPRARDRPRPAVRSASASARGEPLRGAPRLGPERLALGTEPVGLGAERLGLRSSSTSARRVASKLRGAERVGGSIGPPRGGSGGSPPRAAPARSPAVEVPRRAARGLELGAQPRGLAVATRSSRTSSTSAVQLARRRSARAGFLLARAGLEADGGRMLRSGGDRSRCASISTRGAAPVAGGGRVLADRAAPDAPRFSCGRRRLPRGRRPAPGGAWRPARCGLELRAEGGGLLLGRPERGGFSSRAGRTSTSSSRMGVSSSRPDRRARRVGRAPAAWRATGRDRVDLRAEGAGSVRDASAASSASDASARPSPGRSRGGPGIRRRRAAG